MTRRGQVALGTVSYPPSPDFATSSPGPGREVRNWRGWTSLEKTVRSGGCLFWSALRERVYFRLSLQPETG